MENYFNYFTEIEEHFQYRRGALRLLSPLDWALIESFQQANIPIEIVLRGIDLAFEKHAKRRKDSQKVNSLSYCTQAILREFERFSEGLVGKHNGAASEKGATQEAEDRENLAVMLRRTIEQFGRVPERAEVQQLPLPSGFFGQISDSLREIEREVQESNVLNFEQLELRLSVLEEKILASFLTALEETLLISIHEEINRELNRHRHSLKAEQLALVERKMMKKILLERFGVPRLSLFYMPLN